MDYVYSRPHSVDDPRNLFFWDLLREALKRTQDKYGDFTLGPSDQPVVSDRRKIEELAKESGIISIAVLHWTPEVESRLLPVRIPVDRGLLGYRVLLIRNDNQVRFNAVKSLADLSAFRFGQESDWDDIVTLRFNGLPVETGTNYEGLFGMLAAGRFEGMPRGVNEISDEMKFVSREFPGLVVERNLLLHYPMPVYFWFSRSPRGTALAHRAQEGLRAMVHDGTFDRLFQSHYAPMLQGLDLSKRHLIELINPTLAAMPPETEAINLRPEEIGLPANH